MDPLALLRSGEDADFVVTIGERNFRLHAFVLRHASPFFRALQKSGMADSSGTCYFDPEKVDPEVFKAILPYLYTRNLGSLDLAAADLLKLFQLADFLQLAGFAEHMARPERTTDMRQCIEAHLEGLARDESLSWLNQQYGKAVSASFPVQPWRSLLAELLRSKIGEFDFLRFWHCLETMHGASPSDADLRRAHAHRNLAATRQEYELIVSLFRQAMSDKWSPNADKGSAHKRKRKVDELE